eukprot:567237-Amorphochlora_amoeboformis.AAC.2
MPALTKGGAVPPFRAVTLRRGCSCDSLRVCAKTKIIFPRLYQQKTNQNTVNGIDYRVVQAPEAPVGRGGKGLVISRKSNDWDLLLSLGIRRCGLVWYNRGGKSISHYEDHKG